MFNGTLKTNFVLFVVSLFLLMGLAVTMASSQSNLFSSAPISLAAGGLAGGGGGSNGG